MSLKASRILCEFAFALHLSFACTHVLYRTNLNAIVLMGHRIERRLNDLAGMPYENFYRGYFMVWAPSVALALALWVVWSLIGRSRFAGTWSFGSLLAGILIVLTPPALFGETPISLLKRGLDVVLIGAVLGCLLVFLFYRWKAAPAKVIIPAFALLYSFWFLHRGPNEWPSYDGPAGPILGFCAATAWGLYVTHPARRVSDESLRHRHV